MCNMYYPNKDYVTEETFKEFTKSYYEMGERESEPISVREGITFGELRSKMDEGHPLYEIIKWVSPPSNKPKKNKYNVRYYERISYEIDYVRGILCEIYDKRFEMGFDEYQHKLNRILKHAENKVDKAETKWEERRWADTVILEVKSLLESSFEDYHAIDCIEDEMICSY